MTDMKIIHHRVKRGTEELRCFIVEFPPVVCPSAFWEPHCLRVVAPRDGIQSQHRVQAAPITRGNGGTSGKVSEAINWKGKQTKHRYTVI